MQAQSSPAYTEYKNSRSIAMNKPTCYLWKDDGTSQEKYEKARETYQTMGFRTVTFKSAPKSHDILDGIQAVIKNHAMHPQDYPDYQS